MRFFHAPDRPEVWEAWIAHGADYLNTDRMAQMGALSEVVARQAAEGAPLPLDVPSRYLCFAATSS